MEKKLRIGIVGCGGIARAHLGAYRRVGGVEIVSVFDPVKKAVKVFAEETSARVARSLDVMAKQDALDAVSVCSPPFAHLDNCRPFLREGIAILCEKPLEVNTVRATRLAAMARRSKGVFMVAFCHRFHPAILELKRLIDRDVLGKSVFFRNIFGGYLPLKGNHRTDPKLSGGGCLIDHCCHSVDLFRHLVGDPSSVQALAGNILQKFPIEDFGLIHLERRGRAFGEIAASYSLKVCGNWLEWYGTRGTAILSYWNPGTPDLSYRVEGGKEWIVVDCTNHPDRFTGEIMHFLDCVHRGKTPSVTADDGLKANRIVAAIYRSVTAKKRIAVGG